MTAAPAFDVPGRVTLSWTTTWPCPTRLEYGPDTGYGRTIEADTSPCLVHRAVLDGLDVGGTVPRPGREHGSRRDPLFSATTSSSAPRRRRFRRPRRERRPSRSTSATRTRLPSKLADHHGRARSARTIGGRGARAAGRARRRSARTSERYRTVARPEREVAPGYVPGRCGGRQQCAVSPGVRPLRAARSGTGRYDRHARRLRCGHRYRHDWFPHRSPRQPVGLRGRRTGPVAARFVLPDASGRRERRALRRPPMATPNSRWKNPARCAWL